MPHCMVEAVRRPLLKVCTQMLSLMLAKLCEVYWEGLRSWKLK